MPASGPRPGSGRPVPSQSVLHAFLSGTELLQPLDADAVQRLLRIGLIRSYVAGADVLSSGSSGGFLHVIYRGSVRIAHRGSRGGEVSFTRGAGDFFGEIGLFDSEAAAERVTAETDCELFSLPHGALRAEMSAQRKLSEALLWAFGRALSRRLRDAQERASARPTPLA